MIKARTDLSAEQEEDKQIGSEQVEVLACQRKARVFLEERVFRCRL